MQYQFELRHEGVTVYAEQSEYPDQESVIEHAVEIAMRGGLPNSRVWVIADGGVLLVLGVRSAEALRRRS